MKSAISLPHFFSRKNSWGINCVIQTDSKVDAPRQEGRDSLPDIFRPQASFRRFLGSYQPSNTLSCNHRGQKHVKESFTSTSSSNKSSSFHMFLPDGAPLCILLAAWARDLLLAAWARDLLLAAWARDLQSSRWQFCLHLVRILVKHDSKESKHTHLENAVVNVWLFSAPILDKNIFCRLDWVGAIWALVQTGPPKCPYQKNGQFWLWRLILTIWCLVEVWGIPRKKQFFSWVPLVGEGAPTKLTERWKDRPSHIRFTKPRFWSTCSAGSDYQLGMMWSTQSIPNISLESSIGNLEPAPWLTLVSASPTLNLRQVLSHVIEHPVALHDQF